MNRQIVDAFVLNWSPKLNAYFAYSNVVSRDLIVNNKYVPNGVEILGRWIRVVVRDCNSVCEPIRIIDDVFESRIMNGVPEIKVEAVYDGRYKNKFEMFRHNYFEFICDSSNVIQNIKRDGVYSFWITRLHEPNMNSRWRISSRQRSVEPNENRNASISLRIVEAIIHSYSLDGNAYYAWTKSEPRSKIIIERSICKTEIDLLGTWVEVQIDNNNIAQRPPDVVQDVYETRLRYGVTEIRVDFEALPGSKMFYNNYFGNISDPRQMVPRVERDVWYDGWIIFYMKHGVDTRWRVGKDQQVNGPFNNESNGRSNSNIQNYQCMTRNGNNSSPEIDNKYDNGDIRKQNRRSSRSPSPYNRNSRPDYLSDDKSNYEDRSRDRIPNDRTRNEKASKDRTYDEPRQIFYDNNTFEYDNRFENCVASNSPKSSQNPNNRGSEGQNRDNCSRRMNNETSSLDGHQESSQRFHEEVVELDPRRNSEYYTCSEDETENRSNRRRSCDIPKNFAKKDSSKSSSNNTKLAQDIPNSSSSVDKNNSKPIEPSKVKETKSVGGPEKSKEDKEITMLKSKLIQASRLIHSLTNNDFVSEQMKRYGLEEYEELMKLIEL